MINLTEKAAAEVKRVIEEQGLDIAGQALKVSVQSGGCSGFSYGLEFEKLEELTDEQYSKNEQYGVNVAVDKKSDLYLDGTTLDFYSGLDKRGFTFNNPNATGHGCGCGKSFQC